MSHEPTYHDSLHDVIVYWRERAMIAETENARLRLQLQTALLVAERKTEAGQPQ